MRRGAGNVPFGVVILIYLFRFLPSLLFPPSAFVAVHFAAYRGTFNHIRIVKLMLEHGARLDIKSRTDPEWPDIKARTPLDAAKQKGNQHIIKLLEEAGAK